MDLAIRTQRARLAVGLASMLLVAGCASSDTTAPTPSASPNIDGLPPLLVANRGGVARWERGRMTKVVSLQGEVRRALSDPEGGVLVERHLPDGDSIVRVVDGRTTTLGGTKSTGTQLFDTAVIEGRPSFLYAKCVREPDKEERGDLIVRVITSGRERVVTRSCGPEFGVGSASFGSGVIAVSGQPI